MDNKVENYSKEGTTTSKKKPKTNWERVSLWKILTAQIKEEIYYSLECHALFAEE